MTDLKIVPFTGVRYNPEKVPELSKVIAPPYDMISPAEQKELYDRDSRNIVRLILNRDEDDEYADRYARAAAWYRKWKNERLLINDSEPSIYAYRQDYTWEDKTFQRLGFIARVALAEFGDGAFPHESTLSGPKTDRLRLLTACRANFSSIFSLFSDTDGKVLDRLGAETASPPLVEVKDDQDVVHSLWKLSRPEFHSWLNEQMREKQFIIADGHHRYETALEYRQRMRNDPSGPGSDSNYVMMFLAPIESRGLTILPFHRLLTIANPAEAVGKLSAAFEVTEVRLQPDNRESGEEILRFLDTSPLEVPTFVAYAGGEHALGLRMREDFDRRAHLRPGTMERVGALDVTVLHQIVLGSLLGLDEQKLVEESRLSFMARPQDVVEQVRLREDKAGFFLRPTRMEQIWDIALSGQKMPQKSTNFYPKLTTGLVINDLG